MIAKPRLPQDCLSCDQTRTMLLGYFLNDLSNQQQTTVGDHLTNCPSCQLVLSALEDACHLAFDSAPVADLHDAQAAGGS